MRPILAALILSASACSQDPGEPSPDASTDLTFSFPPVDLAVDQPDESDPNPCAIDPSCQTFELGPIYGTPFPLLGDMPPDPHMSSDGVARDNNGYLRMASSQQSLDWGWIANASDWS